MTFAVPPMRKSLQPWESAWTGRGVLALALMASALPISCGKRTTVAGPPVSAPAPRPPTVIEERSGGPLSAPQTSVQLPPAQEIPKGAATAPAPSTTPRPQPAADAPPRRQPPSPTVADTAPAPAVQPEPAAASDLPQLSPLISPNERRSMEAELDQRLAQTRANLNRLSGRTLNGEQVAAVKRIQAFLKQAEDTRQQDLNLARNLAQRAQVLAEDLVRSAR